MKNKQEELQEKADFIRDSMREDGVVMKNKNTYKKEQGKRARKLLEDLKEWIGVLDDEKLIMYIEKDLEISYWKGRLNEK